MSSRFASNILAGLENYHKINSKLPSRVIIYRDGVGDGQVQHVFTIEVQEVRRAIKKIPGGDTIKLIFIIVSKRINTKFFAKLSGNGPLLNPPPGTVVDTVVTRPERFEFFLVSQSTRQGTVTPTNYNVVVDEMGWKPQFHQHLAYKLCHMYFNWMGTIRVPAPCQYAHKLAYVVGTSLHREPSNALANNLYYL
jgi:aubergine-like protein